MVERRLEKQICPECGERRVVEILYGMPTSDAFEDAERGDFILGGCVIIGNDPSRGCTSCGWRGEVPGSSQA